MSDVQTLSKSEFAALCGVSKARVAQWIGDGKLKSDALQGEGRFARIIVDVAQAQLKLRLDTNQRFGMNGLLTNLESQTPAPILTPTLQLPLQADAFEESLKAEKLFQAQIQTRKLVRQERIDLGLYMDSTEAKAEIHRVASDMVSSFEGMMTDFSNALSARFEIPARDILYTLKQEFLKCRAAAAAQNIILAEQQPETITDDRTIE